MVRLGGRPQSWRRDLQVLGRFESREALRMSTVRTRPGMISCNTRCNEHAARLTEIALMFTIYQRRPLHSVDGRLTPDRWR